MKKKLLLLVGLLVFGMQVLGATFTFNFDGSGFISDGASVLDDSDKEKYRFILIMLKRKPLIRYWLLLLIRLTESLQVRWQEWFPSAV